MKLKNRMRKTLRPWLAPFLLALVSVTAHAQVAEFSVSGGVSNLQNSDLGAGYKLDDGWRMAFRITLNSWTLFGQEFGYAYNRSHLILAGQDQGGMAIHQGFYNLLMYATKEGTRIRPFVTGGGHFSNFVPPGSSATYGQGSTKFGVNYGVGVKARLTNMFQIRFDARQFLTGKPFGDVLPVSGTLRQNEFSVGLGFVL
jgi:outer membrane protein with beta-barrel domain